MTKEEELMDYLHKNVFNPVLQSSNASKELKAGINLTIMRMKQRKAEGMRQYFWSAIIGTERSIGFSKQLKDAGFTRFEEVLEDFRVKFDDNWLKS